MIATADIAILTSYLNYTKIDTSSYLYLLNQLFLTIV